jgi:hypothetical protein
MMHQGSGLYCTDRIERRDSKNQEDAVKCPSMVNCRELLPYLFTPCCVNIIVPFVCNNYVRIL